MRPGRERPGKFGVLERRGSPRLALVGFNEAGARTPRKAGRGEFDREVPRRKDVRRRASMRPGRERPGKRPDRESACPGKPGVRSFNEAGARTPRKAGRRASGCPLEIDLLLQ